MLNTRRVLLVSGANDLKVKELSDELNSQDYELIAKDSIDGAHQWMMQHGLPHLILIDLGSLKSEGLHVCQEMYESVRMPIITISDDIGSTEQAVEALHVADDFVRRAFVSSQELALRVRRVLSRLANFSYVTGPVTSISDWLSVDPLNRQVVVHGEVRRLTPIENALLMTLLAHRGEAVNAMTLIEQLWRLDPFVTDRNALRVHVHRLRQKIEADPDQPQLILTERGVGYRFLEEGLNL